MNIWLTNVNEYFHKEIRMQKMDYKMLKVFINEKGANTCAFFVFSIYDGLFTVIIIGCLGNFSYYSLAGSFIIF
jgi:hypothetical protein